MMFGNSDTGIGGTGRVPEETRAFAGGTASPEHLAAIWSRLSNNSTMQGREMPAGFGTPDYRRSGLNALHAMRQPAGQSAPGNAGDINWRVKAALAGGMPRPGRTNPLAESMPQQYGGNMFGGGNAVDPAAIWARVASDPKSPFFGLAQPANFMQASGAGGPGGMFGDDDLDAQIRELLGRGRPDGRYGELFGSAPEPQDIRSQILSALAGGRTSRPMLRPRGGASPLMAILGNR